jgi:galactose oxidase-like protein
MRKPGRAAPTRRPHARALPLALAIASLCAPRLVAQSSMLIGLLGQWTTLSETTPINPVHAVLMHNGKVLIVAGSGNVATNSDYQTAVWDPQTQVLATQPIAWDMFCNGMVVLPDGRPFINGGNLQYDPFRGEPRNAVYDPATSLFTDVQSMARGRWYPTTTTLGDGSVMTFSGLTDTGGTNSTVEIYTVGAGWSQEFPAGWTPPLYPRLHVLPDGRVFYAGAGTGSRLFDPSTKTWSGVVATTNYGMTRTYGTSVLLPLTPQNDYRPQVMILGGGNPSTATTEIIDLSASTPAWQYGPLMSQPRIEMNATILPNGKVLATGGSLNDEDAATASLNADLYDPATNTFSPAGANAFPRLYHSNALLLPDATVLLIGGNPMRGSYEAHFEIYAPAYLFNLAGGLAVRPTITDAPAGPIGYGTTFQVQTPIAADIASVVLVRPGAPTHAFDMEQRLVGLTYTRGLGVLNVTAPPNGNVAPPGYYMLFILNSAGVPSVASFVQVS